MGLDYDGTQLSYQTNPSFTSLRHSSPAPMPSTNNPTFQNQSAISRSVPVNTESLSWDRVHSLPTRSQSPYSFTPSTQGNDHAVYSHIQRRRHSTHYGGRQLCDLGPNASYGHGPGNFTLNPQGQDYVWRHFGWSSNMPVGQDRAQNQFMPTGQLFDQGSTLYFPHYFNPNIRGTTVGQHGYGSNANIIYRSYHQHDSGFQEGNTGSHQHDTGSHRHDTGFQEGDTGSQQDETGQQRRQIPQQGEDDNYSPSPSNKPSSCTGSGEVHLTSMTNTDPPPNTALLSPSTTNNPTESQHEDLYRYHRRRAHSQSLVVERMTTSLVGRASSLTLTRSRSLDSIARKYQSGPQRNYSTSNSPSSTRQVHVFGLGLAGGTHTCSDNQR